MEADAPIEFVFRDDLADLAREVKAAPRLTADEVERMTVALEAALLRLRGRRP